MSIIIPVATVHPPIQRRNAQVHSHSICICNYPTLTATDTAITALSSAFAGLLTALVTYTSLCPINGLLCAKYTQAVVLGSSLGIAGVTAIISAASLHYREMCRN
jgi:hypothetical protein